VSYINNLTLHDLRNNGTRPASAALTDIIMEQITAGQVESCTGGILAYGSRSAVFSGISIDSRTIQNGDLFFAIRGARQDGHRYVAEALQKGAAGIVVDAGYVLPDVFPANRILLRVEDSHRALKDLAAQVREQWMGSLVAITGSMGKTITKEFIYRVLSTEFSVYRSPGNFNNLFGLPLAIFGLSRDDHIGVFELGMSAPGEIAEMCRIASPDAGVITNVAPVHLEFFHSLEEIAHAKGELADGLRPDGLLVYNADDPLVDEIARRFGGPKLSYGSSDRADLHIERIEVLDLEETRLQFTYEGITQKVMIPLGGVHYALNALPAVVLGRHYRIDMEQILEGLRNLEQASMRGRIVRFKEGFTLIDDSYNSNPRALARMLEALAAGKPCSRRMLVAGEMLELGPESAALHYQCGVRAAQIGVDMIVGVQGAAREIVRGAVESGIPESRALFFTQLEPAIDFVAREVRAGDLLLVKGSRGVHLERMVQALQSQYQEWHNHNP